MEMVNYLTDEKIITLKSNSEKVLELMRTSKTNEWLKDFFKEENPFSKSKLSINDFELRTDFEDPSDSDFENAKIIFENLKISESQACDERLWIGLSFGKFYEYMMYRYPVDKQSNLKNKWFFQGYSPKYQVFRQGLSMLWWYVYITYDETRENPYELTEFAFKQKDFLISIYSRNFCGSKAVRLGIIRAFKDFEEEVDSILPREYYNGVIKYISFLGGAYILDLLSEQEIYDKCYAKLKELYDNGNHKSKAFKLN